MRFAIRLAVRNLDSSTLQPVLSILWNTSISNASYTIRAFQLHGCVIESVCFVSSLPSISILVPHLDPVQASDRYLIHLVSNGMISASRQTIDAGSH
jgi:hypothetical protein